LPRRLPVMISIEKTGPTIAYGLVLSVNPCYCIIPA
jgi:hypothetical protein